MHGLLRFVGYGTRSRRRLRAFGCSVVLAILCRLRSGSVGRIRVVGPEIEGLRLLADQVEQVLKATPGTRGVNFAESGARVAQGPTPPASQPRSLTQQVAEFQTYLKLDPDGEKAKEAHKALDQLK